MELAARAFWELARETSRLARAEYQDVRVGYSRHWILIRSHNRCVSIIYSHGDGPSTFCYSGPCTAPAAAQTIPLHPRAEADGELYFQQGLNSMTVQQLARTLVNSLL